MNARTSRVNSSGAVNRMKCGASLIGSSVIVFEQGYPPVASTEGNRDPVRKLNIVNADLGLEPIAALDPLMRGTTDISFVAGYVDGLVGMSLAADDAHAPGETVDFPSIKRQAKRAAIQITRLSKEKERWECSGDRFSQSE